jgi:NADH:ubiquinone oxidoreductase subunit B-like Fe-S oxidoreductase
MANRQIAMGMLKAKYVNAQMISKACAELVTWTYANSLTNLLLQASCCIRGAASATGISLGLRD